MSDRPTLVSFYDGAGEDEWHRLTDGLYAELEWQETIHFLERFLPEQGRILDIGGGAGRYSDWLAERGYQVTLADPSEGQLTVAQEKLGGYESGSIESIDRADVAALPYADDMFDATLCLGGPLSHLLEAEQRRQAVRELHRVTIPDGPVFVSVMGRLAALQTITRFAGRVDPEEDDTELLPDLLRTGDYDQALLERFDREALVPLMHLFRADELEGLLREGGLAVEVVTALESIASQRRSEFDELTDEHRATIRQTVRQLRGDRGAADLSGHILAIGIVQ